MLLIAGLGNPDKKYEKTRHNVGFMVVNALANDLGLTFKEDKKHNSLITEYNHTSNNQKDNFKIVIVKPQTYMNSSGDAIQKITNYYKITPENVWIIHDDIDINLGTIRIRKGGSSAGQKGVQSIIDNIGYDFYRLRFGIKTEKSKKIPSEKFVLKKFSIGEKIIVDRKINELVTMIEDNFTNGLSQETI